MSDSEILMTRKIEVVPDRMMSKIVISFMVLGKPVKVHLEFREPIALCELPRTVLESEEDILEDLEAQVWVHKPNEMGRIGEIASVEIEESEESDEED